MHELAGCRVIAAEGVIDGYVTEYAAGVLRMQLESPLLARDVGDPVTVQVLDPVRGECTYRGIVAKAPGPAVDVVVMETAGQRQRRSAARAPYQVTCLGVVQTYDGPVQLALTVLDVSATGLRFSSKRQVPDGTVLLVHLPAEGTTLELRARVLRVDEARHMWRHGAEFFDVDDASRERLYRLVMRLQREEVRRAAAARD
ncbi:MAG TPA: PilZ domain-containing protein [Cellulomonas sp.]